MKIIAGITDLAELRAAIAGGAGEVYGGILNIPNHRPMTGDFNFAGISEFGQGIGIAHASGVKISFLANELYTEALMAQVVSSLRILRGFGVDGIIVRDLALVRALGREKLGGRIILSSLAAVFNSESLKLFRGLGVSRLIVPQQVTPREISVMRRLPLEMEVFFRKEEYCRNIDGLCLFHSPSSYRRPKRSALSPASRGERFAVYPCKAGYRLPGRGAASRQEIDRFMKQSFLGEFYSLFHMGVEYAKLKRYRGRWLMSELWLARELVSMLAKGATRREFVRRGGEAIHHAQQIREGHISS